MGLREGMDVERVRAIADELGSSTQRLRAVHTEGTAGMRVLTGAWEGSDLERFGDGWRDGSAHLESAAAALQGLQTQLLREADEQDAGSGGSGGSAAGGSGDERPADRDDDDDDDDGGGWGLPNPIDAIGDAWDAGTDAVEDAWDRGSDALDDAWDWASDRGREAVEWGSDRAEEGLSWLGDRGRELLDGAKDFWDDEVVARGDAGVEAAQRLGPSITNFGEQFTQIFTEGRWPRTAEVIASGALLLGRTGGLIANVVTGEDHQIFDSGEGVVVSQNTVPADPQQQGRIPSDLEALMDIQTDTYDHTEGRESDNRHVRVTQVEQPDGSSAYIVTVPGTNGLMDFPGSITGGDEAFDNTSNLELQAGQRSASMEAVMAAMDEAGIPGDAPVLLQGHSQGGMVTAELLQDPEFAQRYNVTHMITEGSPNDSRSIPDDVRTLALEHTNDPVPKVDLGDHLLGEEVRVPLPGNLPDMHVWPGMPSLRFVPTEFAGSGDHVTQIRMDPGPGVGVLSGGDNDLGAHDYVEYGNSVHRELEAGNPQLLDYASDPDLAIFLTDDASRVHITEYGTGRQ